MIFFEAAGAAHYIYISKGSILSCVRKTQEDFTSHTGISQGYLFLNSWIKEKSGEDADLSSSTMAVVTPIPHQHLPAYPSSGEQIWVPGSSIYPFITVHAAHHTRRQQPSLSYCTSYSNTGSSNNVSRASSIKSPPTPFPVMTDIDDTISILDNKDKPLPPTPSAAIFGGEISAEDSNEDSDYLLAGFSGDDHDDDVQVSRELPFREMIEQAADISILDADGNQRPFKSLYASSNPFEKKKRVMVIFVRHFFCGVSLIPSFPISIDAFV